MNRLDFNTPFDLADTIISMFGDINDDYPTISVYGKYNVIKKLLEDLIKNGISIANEIELQDYDVDYYDKEFVLYVTLNGINVEKVWCDGTYCYGSGNISFVHEDCNSKLLKYVNSKAIYEFGYGKNEAYTEDDRKCKCTCYKDKKSVTTSATTYKVNGKEVDSETYEKALNEFNKMYFDNMKDMLMNYFLNDKKLLW